MNSSIYTRSQTSGECFTRSEMLGIKNIETVDSFRTSDGQVFEDEKEAENAQLKINLKLIWDDCQDFEEFWNLCDELDMFDQKGDV